MTRGDFGGSDAARWIAVPKAADDKYSRGVLGVLTGSDAYPGAAVLGVEGAARTGVGMVRYLGPDRAADLVLRARPETVTADGRVQAWLIGSGMAGARDAALEAEVRARLGSAVPTVLDAGALDLAAAAAGPTVLTPHAGELVGVLARVRIAATRAEIAADPARHAVLAARATGTTVLLKGAVTCIADASGLRHRVTAGTGWLATAGSGDVLGGVLGALLATHERELRADPGCLAELAAAAAWLHGAAGRRASAGGPITALDVARALPGTIAELLSRVPR